MKRNEKPANSNTGKDASAERQQSAGDGVGQLTFFTEVASADDQAAVHAGLNVPAKSAAVDETSTSEVMEWRLPALQGAAAESAAAAAPAGTTDPQSVPVKRVRVGESLGQRLTAAREARGWSCEDVAGKLHLPLQVVRLMESEQYERIGYGVYLRGYLTSYARLLEVPVAVVESVLRQHASTPELVASGRISHSRYLIDRYSGSALYVVLTGLIVVPFVMFAMNMGSDVGVRLTPLDVSTPAAVPANAGVAGEIASASTATTADVQAPAAADAAKSDSPLMASLTPFSNPPYAAQAEAPQSAALASPQVRLSVNEASWVEIVDADGKRLEYATLPAGTVKTYTSDTPLDVRLGNTNGVTLEVNGAVQDIAPYNHANVAHFKLLAAGKTISQID
ncbi:MAG: helix-turn-helix domain-containing protein [Rudaea sp.]